MTAAQPYVIAVALLTLTGSLTALAGCRAQKEPSGTVDPIDTCNTAQAISLARFTGADLPPKTIALTFDDGPGPRSLELSHWMKAQGVRATFFVNGKMLAGNGSFLEQLVADGHVVANHTQTHPNLTTLDPSAVVAEVEATDSLIAPYVPDQRFLFRPPFGAYDANTFTALEASAMKKYVGPIDWDIGNAMGPAQAADWDCWQPRGTSDPPVLSVSACGDLYIAEIRAKDHGIVLLHDPYFIDDDPAKGGTVDLVFHIVPILKAEGFQFVTVDEAPSIHAALPPRKPGPAPDASTTTAPPPRSPEPPVGVPANEAAAPRPDPRGDAADPCKTAPRTRLRESGHLLSIDLDEP